MKVILLRDVARLGKRFTVVEVPDGFALNKLIPQKMAEPATPANLKRVEARAKELAVQTTNNEQELRQTLATLQATPLVITVDANAQDHLFKAVKASDIVAAAKAQNLALSEAVLVIAEPIKTLGSHDIKLVSGNINDVFTITIARS